MPPVPTTAQIAGVPPGACSRPDEGGWGYVADTDIYDETDSVLGCGEFG